MSGRERERESGSTAVQGQAGLWLLLMTEQ